jgi:hypothetical protein
MACAECLNSPLPVLEDVKWIWMAFIIAEPRLHQAQGQSGTRQAQPSLLLLTIIETGPPFSGTRVLMAPFVCNDGSAFPAVQ